MAPVLSVAALLALIGEPQGLSDRVVEAVGADCAPSSAVMSS
jgi:hypothetical protein